jgi:hypothetical protein
MGPLEALLQLFGMFLFVLLALAGIAIAGLVWMLYSLRDIRVPPDADFFTTMHYIPITLPILLDILDFSLDFLSAPVSWVVLDRLGLSSLRNWASLEGVIPVVTNPIPTMTIAWLLARMFNLGGQPVEIYTYAADRPPRRYLDDPDLDVDYEYDRPRRRRPADIIDADEL